MFGFRVVNRIVDFRIMELSLTRGSGSEWFTKFVDLLGRKSDREETPPHQTLRRLRNIGDWSQASVADSFGCGLSHNA